MHKNLLRASLVLLLAVGVVAQQRRADVAVPSAERLREDVTFLASDKLEGRRTGTEGARLAAEYIVRAFARSKLRPAGSIAGEDRRYVQPFPFVAGVELGKSNAMSFTQRGVIADGPTTTATSSAVARNEISLDMRLGEDWMPLGFSANGKLSNANMTFVGYGIAAKDLNYDDYGGWNVKGNIAVAFAGTPDGDNPHGRFQRYADVRWKAIAAREAGAVALVVVAREENFKEDRLSRLRYDNSAGDAGLPVVAVSRQVAARILAGLGLTRSLDDLEQIARAANSPSGQGGGNAPVPKDLAFLLAGCSLSLSVDIVRRNAPASNVVGILEGSDPQLKNEAIVIGAHYDHLGRGGEGSLAQKEGEVHHGADDNASGVAGMLELARLFSKQRPRRTIVFVAFSGEEEGLLGSNYYVNHPAVPLARTVAMINMDMIGRLKENKLLVGGVGTAQEWRTLIGNISASTAQPFALTLTEDGYGPSDHSSFYAKQIPVLFFWTGTHADYHKPSDTADKIDYEAEARIVHFIYRLVRSLDEAERRPTFAVAKSDSSQGQAMGFRVYLGTIPNYADSNEGLKLDGVREGSPAEKAGLKAGDVIIKLAGHDVRNVYDYTYILGEMKAGQEYELEALRGGKPLKLKITPTARK
ncbi:MAG: M20/M25/M40 family metallo-hydrolase [Pyrinomonadaceae bacterium]|nr:M20/M25/M40 family metallo-hydrolase [Pyrinomonadaceae bacterium]